jgi:hypothetical protein
MALVSTTAVDAGHCRAGAGAGNQKHRDPDCSGMNTGAAVQNRRAESDCRGGAEQSQRNSPASGGTWSGYRGRSEVGQAEPADERKEVMTQRTTLLASVIGFVTAAAWFTYIAVGERTTTHLIVCVVFWLAALASIVKLVVRWK